MSDLRSILSEINKVDGVHEALVVGRDGFVIEHVGDMDSAAAGAIMSTVIGSVESMGKDLSTGGLFEVMAEYSKGTVIVAPIGRDAILGLAANEGANLGAVRFAVKKHLGTLERAL